MIDIAINKNSVVPLYYQLKESMIDQIRRGILNPGDALPSENEFCRQFGLSRGTVRQAFSILAEQGYISKERGRGTFVRVPTLNHDLMGDYSFGLGIEKLGMQHRSQVKIQKIVPGKARVSERLHLAKKENVFHLYRIRCADGEPWICEDCYLPSVLCPGMESHDFSTQLITDILVREYKIVPASINAYVEPVALNETYAQELQVHVGLPALVMDRVISDKHGTPLIYSHAVVRGDRCRYYFSVKR